MYIHIHMYVYINTFLIATAPFPMGQQCQYLAHGTWPCQRKKNKKNKNKTIYWSGYLSFFPKIGIWHDDILLPSGEGKGQRFFFWVYIQVFSFSLVYSFSFSVFFIFPFFFKKSSNFCDLRVVLFIKRFIFRIRVSGVRVSIMVWLIVANVRGDGCWSACLRVWRLLHGFREIQLHLKCKKKKKKEK